MHRQFPLILAARSLALVLGLAFAASALSATTAFSDTYKGSGSGAACDTTYAITGVTPSDKLKHPVFIYLNGTNESHDNAQAKAAIAYMGARGFVAASVQYRSETFGTCAQIAQKAACVFKPASAASAIRKLCARGDCSKGIVVSGFSQGSIAAILAKNTDTRVKAVYGMGAFTNYSPQYDMTSCMNNGKHKLSSKALRIVNGEKDIFGNGNASGVRKASQTITGKVCGAKDYVCLNSNGSGWIMVKNSQVKDKSADHCYQRFPSDCNGSQNKLDANWKSSSANWALPANLTWLKTFTKP